MGKCKLENLYHEIKSLGDRLLNPESLLAEDEAPRLEKYDEFIPPEALLHEEVLRVGRAMVSFSYHTKTVP